MRQIGTLPDANQAGLLADYLLTLRIQTRIDQQAGGWDLWVCDEDQVEQAREVLAEFLHNPADARYTVAQRAARSLRQDEERQEEEYRRKQDALRQKMTEEPASQSLWVTAVLFAASLLVTLLTDFGQNQAVSRLFTITELPGRDGLPVRTLPEELRAGEVWRLVTPIFLHFGILHLVFNMYWLFLFGGPIELRRGPVRYLGLILLLAIPSNLAQLYLGGAFEPGFHPGLPLNPNFGGMSGVVYGLFGYTWVRSRLRPDLGLMVSTQTVVFLMVWFFVCLSGSLDQTVKVANMAHAVGLAIGILAGFVPIRQRGQP